MKKYLSLINDVYFKYLPQKNQILFIKSKSDFNYILNLTSVEHGEVIRDLFNQTISINDFRKMVDETTFREFQIVMLVLEKAEILNSEVIEEKINLDQLKYWTVLLTGKFFVIQFETILNNEFEVHAQVHEGGPCSPVGATACGTYENYLYECAYDNTWAGLGSSC